MPSFREFLLELSKDTINSYKKKASKDKKSAEKSADAASENWKSGKMHQNQKFKGSDETPSDRYSKAIFRRNKRAKGLAQANKRS